MSDANSELIQGILDRLQAGDQSAHEELFATIRDRLEAMVHNALKKYPGVRRWEETGDVLQNTLLRISNTLKNKKYEFAKLREFFGFASMLIRRELITLLKHHYGPQGHAAHHDSRGGELDSSMYPANPTSVSEQMEKQTRLHECIEKLPEQEQEVLSLWYYHALQQKEIAQLLDISVETVKRRFRKAKIQLAECCGKSLLE
jgi:RNA polymerase sigma factor (sigma-70 family)